MIEIEIEMETVEGESGRRAGREGGKEEEGRGKEGRREGGKGSIIDWPKRTGGGLLSACVALKPFSNRPPRLC